MDFGINKMQNISKSKMNLGGPLQPSCESSKNPFTTKSGITKCLNLLQNELMNSGSNNSLEPMINDKNLFVYPCV